MIRSYYNNHKSFIYIPNVFIQRILRRTSKHMKTITQFNLIHMMSMDDLLAIGVKTLMIDSGCSLEKE